MNITGITIRKHLQRSGLILGLIMVVLFTLLLSACNTGYYGDWSPAWSPDGTKIAFYSTRGGEWAFYVMNSDGSEQNKLANSACGFLYPAWSPDGTKIAYSSSGQVYIMNADGSNQINLTPYPADGTDPTWSPDGTKIAFVSDRTGNYEIYVMNSDGTNPTDLIDSSDITGERYPAWSPDGTRILFCHPRQSWLWSDIYVVDADGTNLTNLTPVENSYTGPVAVTTGISWSPDGTKIAHARYRAGLESMYVEIYVMDADGSNAVRLTYKSDIVPILSLIGKVFGPPVAIILLIIWMRKRRRRAVS